MQIFVQFCNLFYICVILYQEVLSTKEEKITNEGFMEMVKVSIFPSHDVKREKRSGNYIHESMNLVIQSETEEISLRLHRVRRSTVQPVILTATKKGLKEEDNSIYNDMATTVYQDVGSEAMVTLVNNGQNQIVRGSFFKDGHIYTLEPVRNTSNTDDNTHRLTKHDNIVDFTGDAINFNEALESSHRHRREVGNTTNATNSGPRELYLEYVVVIDYENYKIWRDAGDYNVTEEKKDLAVKTEIVQFYRHMVHGIDIIINSASNLENKFHVVFTGMVVCNESGSSPWMDRNKLCDNCTEVDDQGTLMDFYRWRESVLLLRLEHDHAALFTGYNLYHTDMASKSTVGVSYVGTVCDDWSVSIMEERRNALSIHTAAHELGHSFGAYHDGTEPASACLGSDKHIMQPKMSRVVDKDKAHNPWTFSPCSINSIMEYLEILDLSGANCLLNLPHKELMKKPDTQPGLLHSGDEQCQAMFGPKSSVCRDFHYHDWSTLCYGMACKDLDSGSCKSVLPYDGTPCGQKKWCQQGLCEYSEKAVGLSVICPLGDDPQYTCTTKECDDVHIRNGTCCEMCYTEQKEKASTESENTNATTDANRMWHGNGTESSWNTTEDKGLKDTTQEPENFTESISTVENTIHAHTSTTQKQKVEVATSEIKTSTLTDNKILTTTEENSISSRVATNTEESTGTNFVETSSTNIQSITAKTTKDDRQFMYTTTLQKLLRTSINTTPKYEATTINQGLNTTKDSTVATNHLTGTTNDLIGNGNKNNTSISVKNNIATENPNKEINNTILENFNTTDSYSHMNNNVTSNDEKQIINESTTLPTSTSLNLQHTTEVSTNNLNDKTTKKVQQNETQSKSNHTILKAINSTLEVTEVFKFISSNETSTRQFMPSTHTISPLKGVSRSTKKYQHTTEHSTRRERFTVSSERTSHIRKHTTIEYEVSSKTTEPTSGDDNQRLSTNNIPNTNNILNEASRLQDRNIYALIIFTVIFICL